MLDWLWLVVPVVIFAVVLVRNRRAYDRDMTPEQREEERYQMQIW